MKSLAPTASFALAAFALVQGSPSASRPSSSPASRAAAAPAPRPRSADPKARALEERLDADPFDVAALKELADLYAKASDDDASLLYSLRAYDAMRRAAASDADAAKAAKAYSDVVQKRSSASVAEIFTARESYLFKLCGIAEVWGVKRNESRPRAALYLLERVLSIRPDHEGARALVKTIRAKAPRDVIEDTQHLEGLAATPSPRECAAWARDHPTFDKAGKLRLGEPYVLETDLSLAAATRLAASMSRMAFFYRSVYGFDGSIPATPVRVMKNRGEFDEFGRLGGGPNPPGLLAYFSFGGNEHVTAYDMRSQGASLGELYSTLFHEASHQFAMHAGEFRPLPGWLNEGLATLFEGCSLEPTGRVEVYGLSLMRVREFASALRESKDPVKLFEHLLDQVGNPTPDAYCLGWALFYYLHRAVGPDGKWLYRESIPKLLAKCAGESSETAAGPGRKSFDAIVVRGGKLDDVVQAIVAEIKPWMDLLLNEGSERAADFFEKRGEERLAKGWLEPAEADFRTTLALEPQRLGPQLALARIARRSWNVDFALYRALRLLERREGTLTPAERKELETIAAESETKGSEWKRVLEMEDAFRKSLRAAIPRVWNAKGSKARPLSAQWLAQRYLQELPDESEGIAMRREIEDATRTTLRREERLFSGGASKGALVECQRALEVEGRDGKKWKGVELIITQLETESPLEGDFRIRIPVKFATERSELTGQRTFHPFMLEWGLEPVVALRLGEPTSSSRLTLLVPLGPTATVGGAGVFRPDPLLKNALRWSVGAQRFDLPSPLKAAAGSTTFDLDVHEASVKLFVDGALLFETSVPPHRRSGALSIVCSGFKGELGEATVVR